MKSILFLFLTMLSTQLPVVASAEVCNTLLHGVFSNPFIEDAQKRTEKILSLKGKGVIEKKITSHADRQDIIYVYGIPNRVKKIEHQGEIIFRHYSVEHTEKIIASQSLKAGPRPFIDPEAHARWEYQDLSGIMFTTPDVDPHRLWMGVKKEHDWVDFKLNPSIPVILCKEDNYLIPAQVNYPTWLRDAYQKYKATGILTSPSYQDSFLKIDAEGGLMPQAEIPIQIIRYQKNGIITEVTK